MSTCHDGYVLPTLTGGRKGDGRGEVGGRSSGGSSSCSSSIAGLLNSLTKAAGCGAALSFWQDSAWVVCCFWLMTTQWVVRRAF